MASVPTPTLRAIDKLKRAVRQGLLHKEITLSDGNTLDIHYRPMTLAEEERIRNDLGDKGSTPNAYALHLLVEKALNPDGSKMFNRGDIADLKHMVEKQDAEAAMLVILGNEGEPLDMKSPEG